ncbi:MAG: hypothetical protein AUJ57_02875 [Zetaproteobacteria bacterium CG1_02_53_45]|nr:MAG: hypothetical protein AUJ57_02875 [Zetaproteobacteria bacterium CG1_02_53_45]
MKRILFTMTAGLLATALLAGCSNDTEQAIATKGVKMPAFQMQSLAGDMVDSQQLFAGKVVVLNAWATWCPPCRKEMPDLVQLSRLLPDDKFVVVGISVDNNPDDVKNFVAEQKVTFPMFWDKGGEKIAAPIFKSFRFPETFILNREGVVVERIAGTLPWADPETVAALHGIYDTGKLPFSE